MGIKMIERGCATCKFAELDSYKEPCKGCCNFENWTDAKTVSVDEFNQLANAVVVLNDNLTRVVSTIDRIIGHLDKQYAK